MDLTELEFVDDDLEPRILNDKIKELREAMVNGSESYVAGLPMKNFYDGKPSRFPLERKYSFFSSRNEKTFQGQLRLLLLPPGRYAIFSRNRPTVKLREYFTENQRCHRE